MSMATRAAAADTTTVMNTGTAAARATGIPRPAPAATTMGRPRRKRPTAQAAAAESTMERTIREAEGTTLPATYTPPRQAAMRLAPSRSLQGLVTTK